MMGPLNPNQSATSFVVVVSSEKGHHPTKRLPEDQYYREFTLELNIIYSLFGSGNRLGPEKRRADDESTVREDVPFSRNKSEGGS